MTEEEIEKCRIQLLNNPKSANNARAYWKSLGDWRGCDIRDGRFVISAFREAALASSDGVIAMAEGYWELFSRSGELPRKASFDEQLLKAVKVSYKSLSGEKKKAVDWLLKFLR